MNKRITGLLVAVGISMLSITAFASEGNGEILFKTNCVSCHPDGENIINPKEHLKGLNNPAKIVKKVRKGGGGMPVYDTKAISDADVKQIADYIIKTFTK